MRILFDSQIFRVQKFGGVSRYCAELMHGLPRQGGYEVTPQKVFSNNKHLELLGLARYSWLAEKKFPGKHMIERFLRRKEEEKLFNTLKSGSFDIYHPTYYTPPFLKYMAPGKALVGTIHDMTYELYYDTRYNQVHQESINKKNLIKKAKHIITPSESTRQDILKLYPEIQPENVTVIYHGSSLPKETGEVRIALPERYVLYVGKRGKYKNFDWLLNSIADYLKKNDLILICAGGRRFSDEEERRMAKLAIRDKVKYVDISDDHHLAMMYKKAACFIYPSSHEGFGIPILEAYAGGCPSLLANSSCFPEIAADGALYFNNGNADQLVNQLNRLLSDKDLVASLRSKAFERLKDFSWEKTVKKHMELYTKVISG